MKTLIVLITFLFATSVFAEDIISVLQNSSRARLNAYKIVEIEDTEIQNIKNSFDKINLVLETAPSIELVIIEGPLGAEAIMKTHIVASKSIGGVTEAQRDFILAHEMGHIALGHWDQFCDLYKEHIPGEVTQETTDAAHSKLGPKAHEQAYRHEFEADAFAFRLHKKMGHDLGSATSAIRLSPFIQGDSSHPAAVKRIMQLRMIEAE